MQGFSWVATAAVLLFTACGGRGPSEPRPRGSGSVARTQEIYQQIGMLAGPAEFPMVGSLGTLAGSSDSTLLLLSLSMPNSALRFQRDDMGFNAAYRVTTILLQDTLQVKQIERSEVVRVGSFAETQRAEESIIFQEMIPLAPGRYVVRLHVADVNSSRGVRAVDTVNVPDYAHAAKLGMPLIVYQARGRTKVAERPDLIINPRNTIAYGGEAPYVYLEAYRSAEPRPVSLRVVDEDGMVVWSHETALTQGTEEVRHAVVEVPAAQLPFGRLWVEASAAPDAPQRSPLLITASDQWMVANFAELLRFLHYIAHPAELDSLRTSVGPDRVAQWDNFWARRDPLPATSINEFREQFFERVRIATEQFTEAGRPGWHTDRGEVFIVLGAPDETLESQVGRDVGTSNLIEWLYKSLPGGAVVLQFFDRSGFGNYALTQASMATFRTVAARMRPKS